MPSATSESWILDDLVEQLGCGPVAGTVTATVHQSMARLTQPLGDGAEALAIGLIGEVANQLVEGVSELFAIELQARRQRRTHPVSTLAQGDGVHQPRGHVLEAEQDVVGAGGCRLSRDVGGDMRMAVAVGTDPGAPAQVGVDGGRPSAGVATITGLPRAVGCVLAITPHPRRQVEGAVERPIEVGRDSEERLIEEEQCAANLVHR